MNTCGSTQDTYFHNIIRELSARRDVLSSFPARPVSAAFISSHDRENGVYLAAVRCIPAIADTEKPPVPCFFADSDISDEALTVILRGVFGLERAVLYVTPSVLLRELFIHYADSYDIRAVLAYDADMHIKPTSRTLGTLSAVCELRSQLRIQPPVAAFMLDFTSAAIKAVKSHLSRPNPALFGQPYALLDGIGLSHIKTKNIPLTVRDEVGRRKDEIGTVYCRTRELAEITYNALRAFFIPVSLYHSGLDRAERKKAAADFASHKTGVLVCTYGYGGDIWNIDTGYVIFAGLPYDIPSVCRELLTINDGAGEAVFVYSEPKSVEKLTENEAELLRLIDNGANSQQLEWYLL